METVGFIGLGRMGSAMAGNIQKAGYPMVVHDVREAATMPLLQGGAEWMSSPAEVGRRSEVIFTSLPRPEDVEAVATRPEGLLEGIREGSVYLDLSTCGPDLVRHLEPMFRQKGAHVMDAPVLSSPTRAVMRSLIVMVGGERAVYERIQPMLGAFADKVIYAGSLGSGCICKLVHNMMSFAMGQVVAEGLTLGVIAGSDQLLLLALSLHPIGPYCRVCANVGFVRLCLRLGTGLHGPFVCGGTHFLGHVCRLAWDPLHPDADPLCARRPGAVAGQRPGPGDFLSVCPPVGLWLWGRGHAVRDGGPQGLRVAPLWTGVRRSELVFHGGHGGGWLSGRLSL